VSVEGTSARACVGVSAPVAPQLANTALPHLTPASPRRPGAICSRTEGVPGPSAAVDRLGRLLGLATHDARGLLAGYGGWEGRTRRDHRALVLARLGWQASTAGDRKQLDAFLLARALEHDAPAVLLQLACDGLRNERIVRPSVDTLSRRVAAGRAQ
jgi:Domain of unknown function (DUF4158)